MRNRKLKIGSAAKSICDDLSKEGCDMTFSEESRRIINDMGNVEQFEFGEAAATVQRQSCFKHMIEGTFFFLRMWLLSTPKR